MCICILTNRTLQSFQTANEVRYITLNQLVLHSIFKSSKIVAEYLEGEYFIENICSVELNTLFIVSEHGKIIWGDIKNKIKATTTKIGDTLT